MKMKDLVGYFFRGALVLLPIVATTYIVWVVLSTMDSILPVGVPGVGLVLTLALITLVGFLTTNVLGRTAIDGLDRFLARVPLVQLLYRSLKDLLDAFVGEKRRFDRPVAISLGPGSQARMLGFVTREHLHTLGMHDRVAVYLPQSYNFAGNLVLVPRDQVEALDASSAELMTFIVSGGVSGFGLGESMPPPLRSAPMDDSKVPPSSRPV
jgi:uncharacterized membrane protein